MSEDRRARFAVFQGPVGQAKAACGSEQELCGDCHTTTRPCKQGARGVVVEVRARQVKERRAANWGS